jgi:hypothetical protein
MNEQELESSFEDLAKSELEIDETEQTQEEPEPKQLSALEKEASDSGWTSKEEWVSKGKDPDYWRPAHDFIEYGKLRSALDATKKEQDKIKDDFEKRLEKINKMHEADTALKIKALKEQQRKAVSEADTDEFDALQSKIDDMQKEPKKEVAAQPGKDPLIVAWEEKNSWINNPEDPKAQAAIGFWNGFANNPRNSNATTAQALAYVDQQLEAVGIVKPASNPRRDLPTETERASTVPKSNGKLSMTDLTADDKEIWRTCGESIWGGDQKAFLQSVKDSRTGK